HVVHGHRCVDLARVHRVHPNPVLAQLDGEAAHQPHHAVFGGDVMAGVRHGLVRPDRAGQHNGTTSLAGDDMRYTGFDGLPDAGEVDVDHVLPNIVRDLVQFVAEGADAGVRDNDVETAELFYPAVHRGLEGIVIAHVDVCGHDATIVSLDQV